ncbi:unnamed protein product [Symbiodinium pilosum]|uniref:Uncharacterized protein n=1 Tax=Symbiodinium pilosum TaxID=2952 RepID=A0A812N2C1_SYMPI|nr:unnamed protein product [Symbiodinium pilosum]
MQVWDQLKHLREDRDKLKEAAENALQDGDEGGFEFQNMLAAEITEKIDELEGKYGTQPPLPGARNEPSEAGGLPLPPPPPALLGLQTLNSKPILILKPTLGGVAGLPPGLAASIPAGVAANLPPGLAASIPPGVASALGKMPPVPGAPPLPGSRESDYPVMLSEILEVGLISPNCLPSQWPESVWNLRGGGNFTQRQREAMAYAFSWCATVSLLLTREIGYDATKARDTALEPEVIELVHYFKISDRHARMLNEQLKRRNNTYEDDIASLYEILKGDLLMAKTSEGTAKMLRRQSRKVSIRWMEKGVFRGTLTPNPAVEKAAKKYKLDAPSACKLAEVLESREDPDADLRKLCDHLAASNKPSSLVMQMLRDIKAGKPVEPCTRAPAIGSYLHKKETATKQSSKGGRSRTPTRRSPSRGGRHRSRDRGDRGGPRGGRSSFAARSFFR